MLHSLRYKTRKGDGIARLTTNGLEGQRTMPVKYITDISSLPELTEDEKSSLRQVIDKFVFRLNDYYVKLIDWSDPKDPIRRLVIPSTNELQEYGRWDASEDRKSVV